MADRNDRWKAVEFYTIELSQLPDGGVFVAMTATMVDDEEPQLLSQEIVSHRVASIDDALAVIRQGLRTNRQRTIATASPLLTNESPTADGGALLRLMKQWSPAEPARLPPIGTKRSVGPGVSGTDASLHQARPSCPRSLKNTARGPYGSRLAAGSQNPPSQPLACWSAHSVCRQPTSYAG